VTPEAADAAIADHVRLSVAQQIQEHGLIETFDGMKTSDPDQVERYRHTCVQEHLKEPQVSVTTDSIDGLVGACSMLLGLPVEEATRAVCAAIAAAPGSARGATAG